MQELAYAYGWVVTANTSLKKSQSRKQDIYQDRLKI